MKTVYTMRLNLLLFLPLIFFAFSSNAQTPFDGLNNILGSDFMKRFQTIKRDAETKIIRIKQMESTLNPDEFETLKISYNTSADYFNTFLFTTKNTILNRESRKYYFHKNRVDEFHKILETDLNRAERAYKRTFQRRYDEIIRSADEAPDAIIGNLLDLIVKYLPKAVELFKKIKIEVHKYNEQMVDKHLIENNRFKKWDEISTY